MFHLNRVLLLPLAALCAQTWAAQDITSANGQGMVVARDPESGQLRAPTAAEFRSLQQKGAQQNLQGSSARSVASRPAIVVGPGGRRSVRLGESHLVYSVVSRDSTGKLVEQCVDGADAAEQAVAQADSAARHQGHTHESR